jgi:hypothetical protein
MTDLPDWAPEGIDVDIPNSARMYDYMLGGYHNFAVDREYAKRIEEAAPGSTAAVRANRAFVARSVRWLVDAGIRQFLDVGAGIPTLGNVHETAQAIAPESRVMYVDIDPVAIAHSKALLADNPLADALLADLREPGGILYAEQVVGLLDFGQPVAVLFNSMLHFITSDDELAGMLGAVREVLASGSYLTITHGTAVADQRTEQDGVIEIMEDTPTPGIRLRSRDMLRSLLPGLEIVEPGIVPVTEWRPDHPDETVSSELAMRGMLSLVARQP